MKKLFITSAAVVALFATPVLALDVENKDGKDYYVYIAQGDSIDTVVITAGKTAKGLCGVMCTVSLEGENHEMAAITGDKLQRFDDHALTTCIRQLLPPGNAFSLTMWVIQVH